eukprot:m.67139 g.67139  ORF g.67139 m.67139 type:complete len:377 (-) comp12691_c0_seq2:40-1170(-)
MSMLRRIFSFDRRREALKTDIDELGSQGVRESKDKSAAFVHGSTSPPTYYLCSYGISSINMDRGGIGHGKNGTNFACIFDGVTSGGKINAYAAQAFTDFMMGWLAENHADLGYGGEANLVDVARAAFQDATRAENNPGRADSTKQAEGGSATGAFIAFQKAADGRAVLHGASIGDAAAIVVRPCEGTAHQLNPVYRKHERDNGGQLTMCLGLDGQVWSFANEVAANEFVVLATDGLTDNILHEDFDRVVPLIMAAQLFDSIVAFDCEYILKEPPEAPTYAFLRKLTSGHVDPPGDITCEAAARRLFNYVEWVTRIYHRQEEAYYGLCLRVREAHDDGTRASLQAEVTRMAADRKARKKVCKTDDAMIIVLRPFHAD